MTRSECESINVVIAIPASSVPSEVRKRYSSLLRLAMEPYSSATCKLVLTILCSDTPDVAISEYAAKSKPRAVVISPPNASLLLRAPHGSSTTPILPPHLAAASSANLSILPSATHSWTTPSAYSYSYSSNNSSPSTLHSASASGGTGPHYSPLAPPTLPYPNTTPSSTSTSTASLSLATISDSLSALTTTLLSVQPYQPLKKLHPSYQQSLLEKQGCMVFSLEGVLAEMVVNALPLDIIVVVARVPALCAALLVHFKSSKKHFRPRHNNPLQEIPREMPISPSPSSSLGLSPNTPSSAGSKPSPSKQQKPSSLAPPKSNLRPSGSVSSRLGFNKTNVDDDDDDDDDDRSSGGRRSEDDDDGESEEDKEPSSSSEQVSRRKGNPSSGAGVTNNAGVSKTWTPQDTEEVLKFYGLKSLNVQEWTEDVFEHNPYERNVILMTSSSDEQHVKGNVVLSPTSGTPAAPAGVVGLGVGDGVDANAWGDPLGIKGSILGKTKRRTITPNHYRLLISSKTFDPKMFIRTVHSGTSYRDMETGVKNLEKAIQQRNEIMKQLVKQHFAKFVNAKSTIDSFYSDIRANNLVSSTTYGITPFTKTLDVLTETASNLYSPLLQRRLQAEKIRITLSVLEQWKFFFNLPSSLSESIAKGKHDAAVRDYKKGKYLMTTSFSAPKNNAHAVQAPAAPTQTQMQATPVSAGSSHAGTPVTQTPIGSKDALQPDSTKTPAATSSSSSSDSTPTDSLLPEHYRKVFEEVWNEVEKIVSRFRDQLFDKLEDPNISLEAQERVMAFLIELDAPQDPVWFYLDSQYRWIIAHLMSTYERHLDRLEALKTGLEATLRLPPALIPAPKPHYIAHDFDTGAAGAGEEEEEGEEEYEDAMSGGVGYNAFYYSHGGGGGQRTSGSNVSYASFRRQSQRWLLNSSAFPSNGRGGEGEDEKPLSWILRKRKGGLRRLEEVEGVEEVGLVRRSERMTLSVFKRALGSVQTKAFDYTFVEDYDHQVWKATLKLVRALCRIMRTSLQDFWKLCRIYAEDRIQKSKQSPIAPGDGTPIGSNTNLSSNETHPKTKKRADVKKMLQCQSMIKNIVELYSTLLSHAFFLETPLTTVRNAARYRSNDRADDQEEEEGVGGGGGTGASSSPTRPSSVQPPLKPASSPSAAGVTGVGMVNSPSVVSVAPASATVAQPLVESPTRPASVMSTGIPGNVVSSAKAGSSSTTSQAPVSPTRSMSIAAGMSPASSAAMPTSSAASPSASVQTPQQQQQQQTPVQQHPTLSPTSATATQSSSASPSIRSSVMDPTTTSYSLGASGLSTSSTQVQVTPPPPIPPAPPLDYGSSFLATHPLTCVHWVSKIIGELVRCFDEVRSMRVGGGTAIEERVLRSLGGSADFVRRRCVEAIAEGLLYESRKFHEYEDWSFDPDQPNTTSCANQDDAQQTSNMMSSDATQAVRLYYRFQKTMLRCLQKIVSAPISADLPPLPPPPLLIRAAHQNQQQHHQALSNPSPGSVYPHVRQPSFMRPTHHLSSSLNPLLDWGDPMIPGSMTSSATTPSALYLLGFEMGPNALLEPTSLIPTSTHHFSETSSAGGSSGLTVPPSPSSAPGLLLLDKIRSTFFEALHGCLDGLEFLANRSWVERRFGGGSVGGVGIGSGNEEDDKWVGLERWHQQVQVGMETSPTRTAPPVGGQGGMVGGSNLAYSIRGNGNQGGGGSRLYLNTSLIERKMEELALPVYEKLKGADLVLIGGGAHVMGGSTGLSLAAGGELGGDGKFGESRWTKLVGGGNVGSRFVGGLDRKVKSADIRKVDTRSLIVISNLNYLKNVGVPKLVALLELKFKCHIANDVKFLYETIDHLDSLLFNNYVRRKGIRLAELVRAGILYSGLDWNDLGRPQEIRPHCYDILMHFVLAHAEVSDASASLVKRVMTELVSLVAQDLLMTFRGVDRFGVAGAMQATLETEFIHQTLSKFENPLSKSLFEQIYATIEKGCIRVDETPEELMTAVKEYLASAKLSTALQFSCFTEVVIRSEGEGGGEDTNADA
ncbi:hypothetical protein HDV05_004070 [Chytridiales sp. JEL 0842]|nr:hypothetical protein HDV05_004070 [Chytridiales sp. JEL 0842]